MLSVYIDNKTLGIWFSEITLEKEKESMDLLVNKIDQETTKFQKNWNDYWNNHVCFCCIGELYMTFCYTIKNGDTGLLKYTLREVGIIF